jgi:hypothetical protein
MISDAEVILNRCGREGCGIVGVLVARRQQYFMVREFAGLTPCEFLADHDMSEWTRVTILRDVLILRALWTVGRSITPGLLSDPTAHILADSLGWRIGDAAMIDSLPDWLRLTKGSIDLSWEAVILAARVAEAVRDDWHVGHVNHVRWGRIHTYLRLWADRVH